METTHITLCMCCVRCINTHGSIFVTKFHFSHSDCSCSPQSFSPETFPIPLTIMILHFLLRNPTKHFALSRCCFGSIPFPFILGGRFTFPGTFLAFSRNTFMKQTKKSACVRVIMKNIVYFFVFNKSGDFFYPFVQNPFLFQNLGTAQV